MKTISLKTAKAIAADWHGGQWTALYAFASSRKAVAAQAPLCLTEIEQNIGNECTAPKQIVRLKSLKKFFSAHLDTARK